MAGGNVSFDSLAILAHRLVQISQPHLDAQIVGLRHQQLFQQSHRFGLPIALQVNLGELHEQRPRLAHHPLLDIQVGKFLERAYLFGSQLGNAFINRDGFGQEPVADKQLRQTFEVIDGLKRFALTDIQLADGHQGDLIARFVLQNLLVFRYGLGDFALVEKFLSGFDKLAFVIGHSRAQTISRPHLLQSALTRPSRKGRQKSCLTTLAGGETQVNEPSSPCSSQLSPL